MVDINWLVPPSESGWGVGIVQSEQLNMLEVLCGKCGLDLVGSQHKTHGHWFWKCRSNCIDLDHPDLNSIGAAAKLDQSVGYIESWLRLWLCTPQDVKIEITY